MNIPIVVRIYYNTKYILDTPTARMTKRKKRKAAVALAPHKSSSRKQARKLTTLFHKYTRLRESVKDDANQVEKIDGLIEEMGGRQAYQRASQVSTSFFSTSKWVLGFLSRNGWLYGIRPAVRTKKVPRRTTRVLEVGAINTQFLDAAAETVVRDGDTLKKYKLDVRAIDLHSMFPDQIEEADFLKIPLISKDDPEGRYDVIVCSMVLNCVPTSPDRGEMMTRLFHFLRPGGLLFLTIPKSCLSLSPFMDRSSFCQVLEDLGLDVKETKDSPKISFFVCSKNPDVALLPSVVEAKWGEQRLLHRGKKYRNDFALTLAADNVLGKSFHK